MSRETHVAMRSLVVPHAGGCLLQMYRETRGCLPQGVRPGEGYWSRLKNSIRGTHVHISQKYSQKYICEFSFRYKMRKQPAEMFAKLISSI